MIEYMEDDVNGIPDSDFAKAAARVFYKIDHGKDGVLSMSKFVDLNDTLGEGFHSEELLGHMRKVDPQKSGGLD